MIYSDIIFTANISLHTFKRDFIIKVFALRCLHMRARQDYLLLPKALGDTSQRAEMKIC